MRLKRVVICWMPVVLWASLIFAISHATPSELSTPTEVSARTLPTFVPLSVLAHIVEFGVLAILVYRLVSAYSALPMLSLMRRSFLISAAYGVIDEIHQYFVPGRFCSLTDVALDVAGAMLGLMLAWAVVKAASRFRGYRPS